jgi:polysaccharide biosynthesis protein PslH
VGRGKKSYFVVRALERAIPSLHITGRVDDIRPYLERASVYITPMRSGSGTRLKVFEAMASRKAIVSTSIGAEGLPVEHEKNILLAETPEDFARQCVRLLRDRDLRRGLGDAARRLVEEKYSWARVVDDFEEIVQSVAERHQSATEGPRAAAAR